MEVETNLDPSLQHILKNRLAKNELKRKYKVSRQEYNRDRRRFLAEAGFSQSSLAAKNRPEIIPLITATIREEHQRLVKQYKNSLVARESNQKIRLKQEEVEQRVRELPLKIQGLEDLRDLWRALQNYAEDLHLTNRMAFILEKEQKNIMQTVYAMVKPSDQPHIDLFVECFKTKECILKWKELLGSPIKWQIFFTK